MTRSTRLKKLQGEWGDFSFEAIWYPGNNLNDRELTKFLQTLDDINQAQNPLGYGVLDQNQPKANRIEFLKHSIWFLLSVGDKPVGLSYMYDLGDVRNTAALHFGLVKINGHLGKELIALPYVIMGLGNLLNFGPHLATNISHLPIIIELFGEMAHQTFPAFEHQDPAFRKEYLPVLELLTKTYLAPIVGYDPKKICERIFRIKKAFEGETGGFETMWQHIPKSTSTLCNLFMKEWLSVTEDEDGHLRIKDDLIQIGKVDFRFLAQPRAYRMLNLVHISDMASDLAPSEQKLFGWKKSA